MDLSKDNFWKITFPFRFVPNRNEQVRSLLLPADQSFYDTLKVESFNRLRRN